MYVCVWGNGGRGGGFCFSYIAYSSPTLIVTFINRSIETKKIKREIMKSEKKRKKKKE